MIKISLLLGLLLLACSVRSQDFFSDKLEGRVYSEDDDVAATHVLNMTTQRATITDISGFFSIPVSLNDTLVFSAVQYKRKEIVVTLSMLESKLILIPLEESLTELDEVIVMPYSLSGDVSQDLNRIGKGSIVTASTLGLTNAYVKPVTKAERELYTATSGGGIIPIFPIINGISGRTKMLKNRIQRNEKYARTQRVRKFYVDSLYTTELKIPEDKVDDFLYFCEVDVAFQATVDTHDRLQVWEFLRKKSLVYRKNNDMK